MSLVDGIAWEKDQMTPGEKDRIMYQSRDPGVEEEVIYQSHPGATQFLDVIEQAQKAFTPARLPTASAERENYPICRGVFDYFPDALAEVAKLSYDATKQHHPDAGMHWDRGKSTAHDDKILRHMMERGTVDTDGHLHDTKVAWRALAQLQELLEKTRNLPPSRASRGKRTWETK